MRRRSIVMLLIAMFLIAFSLYIFSSSIPKLPKDVEQAYIALPESLDYNIDVKPILSDKCFACHGPDKAKQKAGLRLDLADFAYAPLPENKGKVAISPGSLDDSEAFHRILSEDPKYKMPTPASHLNLTPIEKAILVKWIKDGAVYKPHWAFVKPVKVEPPKVKGSARLNNPIDNFIVEKLQKQHLKQSSEANKELLLRRVSLDLTGLPPTIEEIDLFLKDQSPNAYERQVDRLLQSKHYGEKMAVDWLDVARFADSYGYTVDRLRDMSPYRDWVIKAFNDNIGYHKFIQWQLAGDLMPHPTKEMIIATAFNRNHQQNMEGGIIEQEFQTEYVIDRTNTFGDAMLGLSVGCAKCHDHKYDPISQKNYYELFSFFNNVKEAGQISWDNSMPAPTLLLPDSVKEQVVNAIKKTILKQQKKIKEDEREREQSFLKWLKRGQYGKVLANKIPADGLQAYFNFDQGNLKEYIDRRQVAVMKRDAGQPGDAPVFTAGSTGKGLALDGDSWLDLNQVGVFRKSEPFSIGIWVSIPKHLTEGVIFHKSSAERLYNFKGYHLYLKDNRLELNMAHAYPANAITKLSTADVPRNKWIQLTMTYDGSSSASGLKLYLDGSELKMETIVDKLDKDILFGGGSQPGLQIGAWWRGRGLKEGVVDDIAVYNRNLSPIEVAILAKKMNWNQIVSKYDRLTDLELNSLRQYYFAVVDPQIKKEGEELKLLRTTLADSTENIQELMVMREMSTPKKTFLLKRGNYDMPGEQVFPNTPASILAYAKDLPKNRYGLAQWLTNPDHPLTARVAVNRVWQNFFGVGLVKTAEDFGNQGEMPSHLELLDWLAVSFRESGWNVKKLNKMIVMSATYRQDSKTSKEAREKDPENRLLSHGPAYRMSAEMIRDNALMASGLLNTKIGGKSMKPYQPEGLWEINNTSYTQDKGPEVYRRSLYVIVKRSVPNPTLSTFDATSRSYCVIRRQKTNTPLQALVTLNDPTFLEASKVMGEQMARQADSRLAISQIFRKLTGRRVLPKELELLTALQQIELDRFRKNPRKQSGWLSAGQYKIDKTMDSAMIAANAVIASTILNSDATLTKR
ncbi:DUF1553 domain-containing protein [Pedobacter frigoris]|uniref:DUF1553 domain-containing protein n=1 Tax=Pedobacter frigoris TaxID=2571272 RepID=UPI00292F01FE|nr:DUF1553 domain-containing protein [Pedobacter frigoris]